MSRPHVPHRYHPYHPLAGCQLKMLRANEHAKDLDKAIDEFTGREPYKIVHDFESEPGYHLARLEIRERPPLWWSPVVGDIVHNVRSALDHLMWQLVLRNNKTPTKGNLFPIFTADPLDPKAHATKGDFKTARKRWKERVRRIHPNDVALIQGLQPYERSEIPDQNPLARLNELSNWDKHREFHFVGQSFADWRPSASMKNASFRLLYLKPRGETFEDGEVMARLQTVTLGPNPKLDVNLKVFFDIAFGEGGPLEGLGIKETLSAIGLDVSDIIMEFKARIDNQDFSPPS